MPVHLRPILQRSPGIFDPADLSFLYRVYASTRAEELAMVDWDAAQKEAFLLQQFNAQHAWYTQNYPGALFHLVHLDEEPIGRLYLHSREKEIRVMDIALLPEYRGRGIGTALLADVLAEGRRGGKTVSIHVEIYNPALRLYSRLGFRPVADRGVYWLMEWSPLAPEASHA